MEGTSWESKEELFFVVNGGFACVVKVALA